MNKHEGSTLDSLFEELGELEEVEARAAKRILAIEANRRMKELGLTTSQLAALMRTSRNQIHRILDQEDAGITLKMLFRLAEALKLPLTVTLGTGATGRTAGTRAQTQKPTVAKTAPSARQGTSPQRAKARRANAG